MGFWLALKYTFKGFPNGCSPMIYSYGLLRQLCLLFKDKILGSTSTVRVKPSLNDNPRWSNPIDRPGCFATFYDGILAYFQELHGIQIMYSRNNDYLWSAYTNCRDCVAVRARGDNLSNAEGATSLNPISTSLTSSPKHHHGRRQQ